MGGPEVDVIGKNQAVLKGTLGEGVEGTQAAYQGDWFVWGSQLCFGDGTLGIASRLQCQLHRLCESQHG